MCGGGDKCRVGCVAAADGGGLGDAIAQRISNILRNAGFFSFDAV